ncbi:TKL protein kinase [Aphanomyces astaci]|uniref:TKL protein kinase n=1 Tax=Aphanomyces astaci TaxID=112090 RepID=W4G149_APHAT|nr:TKL protein kinase [Aphanomyces astaci]ETV72764.1 TKL protein kinase [Aphanomyces astaci]RQM26436.1 hypothetical protein B5M09_004758 [Aphanomyces astaci]|eukprot:XP_009837550.1 TKL protein kinase [Aphanomyces astaci]
MNTTTSTTTINGTVTNVTVLPGAKPTLSPQQQFAIQQNIFLYEQYQILQIVYSLTYAFMFFLTMALIIYLRRSRTSAFKGDVIAANKVILPSFEPLFWVIACSTGIYTTYFFVATIFGYTKPITNRWFGELLVQGRQFILYLIVAFLLQRSVSRPALVRSVLIALVMAVVPVIVVHLLDVTSQDQLLQFVVVAAYRTILMGGFAYLFFRPMPRASVRTQQELCLFALIYYIIVYVYTFCFYEKDYQNGMILVFCAVVWATFGPFFVWRLLKADTQHWRGLSDRACDFQQLFRENQGMQEIVSAQGLHVMLEMHRKDVVDFSHLDIQRQMASGASANVYRGVLHSTKQVAVKVYSPSEISESTILEFSQEAALCTALKHPNIVLFHGMCICPPSICLIYELCRGSLEDALRKSRADHMEPLWPKLCYMLDAARAVAYLHSFSPPFIHRDIKPANFLLDASNVVKLTDFGESRSMAFTIEDIANDNRAMTVRGTVDYMAPEIIDGKQGQALYTETADIYSLAITLWDILHPGREKFPNSNQNHLNIFRMVLDGQRPPIDPEIPQTLQDLLENCWNSDPIFRPSAKMVVAVLEDMQEDMCGQVSHELSGVVSYLATLKPKKSAISMSTFSGVALVQCFIDHGYAFEIEEAVRFGNSLMDAGCLHHSKHNQPFENSVTATYTFDSYQLEMNEPLEDTMTAAGGSTLGDGSGGYVGTSILGDVNATCACRKLGQGHVKPKGLRKKFFRNRKDDNQMALAVNLLNQTGGDMDFVGYPSTTSSNATGTRTLTMHMA